MVSHAGLLTGVALGTRTFFVCAFFLTGMATLVKWVQQRPLHSLLDRQVIMHGFIPAIGTIGIASLLTAGKRNAHRRDKG